MKSRSINRTFALWFSIMMGFFVLANLAGMIKPMGLKPFRQTGFPFVVAAWGIGIEEFFDWWRLFLNLIIALAVSTSIAYLIAARNIRVS